MTKWQKEILGQHGLDADDYSEHEQQMIGYLFDLYATPDNKEDENHKWIGRMDHTGDWVETLTPGYVNGLDTETILNGTDPLAAKMTLDAAKDLHDISQIRAGIAMEELAGKNADTWSDPKVQKNVEHSIDARAAYLTEVMNACTQLAAGNDEADTPVGKDDHVKLTFDRENDTWTLETKTKSQKIATEMTAVRIMDKTFANMAGAPEFDEELGSWSENFQNDKSLPELVDHISKMDEHRRINAYMKDHPQERREITRDAAINGLKNIAHQKKDAKAAGEARNSLLRMGINPDSEKEDPVAKNLEKTVLNAINQYDKDAGQNKKADIKDIDKTDDEKDGSAKKDDDENETP